MVENVGKVPWRSTRAKFFFCVMIKTNWNKAKMWISKAILGITVCKEQKDHFGLEVLIYSERAGRKIDPIMFLIYQGIMIFLSLNFIDFDKLWTLSCFRESHRGIDFYVKKICRINISSLLKACGGYGEQDYWIKGFSDQHADKLR